MGDSAASAAAPHIPAAAVDVAASAAVFSVVAVVVAAAVAAVGWRNLVGTAAGYSARCFADVVSDCSAV